MVNGMDKELRTGLMVANTWVSGKKEKLMDRVSQFIKMEIFMRENGKMIWLMDMGLIKKQPEQYTRAIGKMTNNMAKAKRPGQTVLTTKDNLNKEQNQVRVY